MRDVIINLLAEPAQRDLIDYAASLLDKSRSDFMLEEACERARAVVLSQARFGLNTEKVGDFMALLDTPAEPNAGLARLMAVKAPWIEGSI